MYSYSFPPPQTYIPPQQAYYAQYPALNGVNNFNNNQQGANWTYSFYMPQSAPFAYPYQPQQQQQMSVQPAQKTPLPQVSSLPPETKPAVTKPEGNNQTVLWYINDLHGRLDGSKRLVTAAHQFDDQYENKGVDTLKIASGDVAIGSDDAKNAYMFDLMRLMGIDAKTPGNHEFDMGTDKLAEHLDKIPSNFVVTNLNTDPSNPLHRHVVNNKILRSAIIEENGTKYGYLGAIPTNLKERLNADAKETAETMSVDNLDQTIVELQQEVDKLKAQGVDRIILSAHMEDDEKKKIAENTSGIDIITGAHTHKVVDGVKEGENFVYNKDGDPVLITQAGKDGKHYGVAKVTWDDEGRIIKAENNVYPTKNIPQSALANHFEIVHMGPAKVLANITNKVDAISEEYMAESAISDLITDAMRAKTGADVAFSNIGSVRGSVGPGEITDRQIMELLPYENELKTFKYSEKDIIDVLKGGVASHVNKAHGPSAIQVSGLRYKIDEDNKIDDVFIQQKDGTWKEIDEEHPSENTFYTVVYDTYLGGGPKYLEMMNCPEKMIKAFGVTTTQALIDYLASFNNRTFELKPAGRIEIESKD